MEERFLRFQAMCTHKYSNWLIQDDVYDFKGAMRCFDKYELAAEGSSDSDEGIAVSAAVLKTDKPEEKLREFREAAQDERINKLSQAVEVLAMRTERTAGAIDRPFCDGCRITGHTMANCRFNPAAPNYCGHAKGEGRRYPNQNWRPRQEPPAPPQERDPRGDQPEGGFGNNRKRGRDDDSRDHTQRGPRQRGFTPYGGQQGYAQRNNGDRNRAPRNGDSKRQSGECWGCGQTGHKQRDCKANQPCQLCNERGHIATECAKWKQCSSAMQHAAAAQQAAPYAPYVAAAAPVYQYQAPAPVHMPPTPPKGHRHR